MEYRQLGKSGVKVSLVGLGCNNFGGRMELEASRKTVHKALDLGINLLDTADVYGNKGGSEECLGLILGPRRKDIVLATKFGQAMDDAGMLKGLSRRHAMQALEASLRRLKTDWIDLYQIHWPDGVTPVEETLRAMDDMVRQGKVRYIGCSNFSGWQLVEALWTSRHLALNSFVSAQNEYSLLARGIETELVPAMRQYGVGFLPYFPLASGLLTGKYKRDAAMPMGTRMTKVQVFADKFLTEANWRKLEKLDDFCAKHGRKMLELAFSWLACRPVVSSVIAGATSPEQLEQNVAAVGWKLADDDMKELDALTA